MAHQQKPRVANPVIAYLLEGLGAEASEQGHERLANSYKKALVSVQKYPLPLQNGTDAMQLEGVGPFIAKKLDKLLLRVNGQLEKARKQKEKRSREENKENALKTNGAQEGQNQSFAKRKRVSTRDESSTQPDAKKQRTAKGYTPRTGSGPYAVVLALGELPRGEGATKADIIESSAPFCDDDLQMESVFSSAIRTLLQKNLIAKASTSQAYCLTAEGEELVARLSESQTQAKKDLASIQDTLRSSRSVDTSCNPQGKKAADVVNMQKPIRGTSKNRDIDECDKENTPIDMNADSFAGDGYRSPVSSPSTCRIRPRAGAGGVAKPPTVKKRFMPVTSIWASPSPLRSRRASPTKLNPSVLLSPVDLLDENDDDDDDLPPTQLYIPPSPFRFYYVDSDGCKVASREEAAVMIEGGHVFFRVFCSEPPTNSTCGFSNVLSSPTKANRSERDDMFPPLHSAWIRESDAPLFPPETSSLVKTTASKQSYEVLKATQCKTPPSKKAKNRRKEDAEEPPFSPPSRSAAVEASSAKPNSSAHHPHHRTLKRGEFEIVLLADTREIRRRGEDHSAIAAKLVKMGVNCEVRNLTLGDFLWVARVKGDRGEIGGEREDIGNNKKKGKKASKGIKATAKDKEDGSQQQEYVLNYVVERKKLEDLWGSIKDGRYYEQKFRLAKSGIGNVIYLVEGNMPTHVSPYQQHQLPVDTLESAMVSTQVSSGFFVQRTSSLSDSLRYLREVTSHIVSSVSEIVIDTNDEEDVPTGDDPNTKEGEGKVLQSYAKWSGSANKSSNLTVRDLFAMQLMQITGMSGRKARAVVEVYPTPVGLWKAYQQCSTQQEKDKLLAGLTVNNRRFGDVLSKRICQTFS